MIDQKNYQYETCEPGDPDPHRFYTSYNMCSHPLPGGPVCTRPVDHEGRHVACGSSGVVEMLETGSAPDPGVTYADLPVLRRIQEAVGHSGCGPLVDRLIARAEADRPPLPEGWVLLRYPDGSHGVWWYPGHGDLLTRYDDGGGGTIDMVSVDIRRKVTPLRPTITEVDFMKGLTAWQIQSQQPGGAIALRAAFAAAGIEVAA